MGTHTFADELSNCIGRQEYTIRDWDREDERHREKVLEIEYEYGMFEIDALIESGKPITITLSETPESFAKR